MQGIVSVDKAINCTGGGVGEYTAISTKLSVKSARAKTAGYVAIFNFKFAVSRLQHYMKIWENSSGRMFRVI